MPKLMKSVILMLGCTFAFNAFAASMPKSPQKVGNCELMYQQKKMDQVVKVCEKESKTNSPRALFILGYLYQQGINVEQNFALAGNYLQQAADLGDAEAQYLYAYLVYSQKIPNVDQRLSVLYFQQAAAQNDPRAQFMLGVIHAQGKLGLDKDEKEAFKYYKSSADNGFARAQVEVSKCYSLGLGVKADEKEAVKYLQMAVEQGDLMAKYILGIMYYRGLDIEKNVDKAIELLGQAAREGHRGAQVACEEIKCYKK
ncbi:MAG: sel1 repeat family protein [Succinivibrionaceae bacterium]|nr:sel1 repeat family protein [Succinivibrionaceae bacterium]